MIIQIEEQVLPDKYQQWITNEINRILRDLENQHNDDNAQQSVWRRENDIRSELEKSKVELSDIVTKLVDIEKKYDYLKQQAALAEEKEMQALYDLEKAAIHIMNKYETSSTVLSDEGDNSSVEDVLNKIPTKGN